MHLSMRLVLVPVSLSTMMFAAGCTTVVGDLGEQDSDSASTGAEGSATDSGGSEGGSGSSAEGGPGDCQPADCGPAPGAPNYACPDGSLGGPACHQVDGACTWVNVTCTCSDEDCGPQPGAPDVLCPDGVNMAGIGDCVDLGQGCGWEMKECPPCCDPGAAPACFEGSSCCADGTWACNDDQGNPTCETGLECQTGECCPAYDGPPCIEGVTCCADGSWACNGDGGNPTCDLGIECSGDCCDPADEPPCIEGAVCCEDGTWACNELGNPPCNVGTVCGGECVDDGGSCASGEACCNGLICCSGVPVPRGDEYCGVDCPMSDRNRKENFATVDAAGILAKVLDLPITTWNYTFDDPAIRHLGPMAQDFKAAFSLGSTDKAIFTIDADGVALASIQALHAELKSVRQENEALKDTLEDLRTRLDRLEKN